jgi:hypothetical protein
MDLSILIDIDSASVADLSALQSRHLIIIAFSKVVSFFVNVIPILVVFNAIHMCFLTAIMKIMNVMAIFNDFTSFYSIDIMSVILKIWVFAVFLLQTHSTNLRLFEHFSQWRCTLAAMKSSWYLTTTV